MMNSEDKIGEYVNALLEKSEEAYLLALEIINKPTIKYRTEGFCFFISNAWELALKAFIIRREEEITAIDYKNKPNQTLGLNECIEKVFPSTTDKKKLNLAFIKEIRNTATHNILPDYDFEFTSLFQKCISNYLKFFKKHFPTYEINNQVKAFVALSHSPENISPLILNPKSLFQLKLVEGKLNNAEDGVSNITQTINLVSTKKVTDADVTFATNNNANTSVVFVDVPKDFNKTHPFTHNIAVKMIQESLELSYKTSFGFNKSTFQKFCKKEKIKTQSKYCYVMEIGESVRYLYSHELIEYVVYKFGNEQKIKKRD